MKKIKRFIRKFWWVLVVGAAIIFAVLWKLLGPKAPDPELESALKPPTFLDRARDNVDRVHLEGEVEKARVRAEADSDKRIIDAIEEMGKENPKVARRDIAIWLNANL
jgi:hypothetical protein